MTANYRPHRLDLRSQAARDRRGTCALTFPRWHARGDLRCINPGRELRATPRAPARPRVASRDQPRIRLVDHDDDPSHDRQAERSGSRDSFELVTRWAAEPLDLLRELRKLKPTVVHFSGHGSQSVAGEHPPGPTSAPYRGLADPLDVHDGERRQGLFFEGPGGR